MEFMRLTLVILFPYLLLLLLLLLLKLTRFNVLNI